MKPLFIQTRMNFTTAIAILVASTSSTVAETITPKHSGSPAVLQASSADLIGTTMESLLNALGMIESGNNDKARGRSGEVSRYQIMPSVWRAYRGGNPRNEYEATRVASKIMSDRIERFQSIHGRSPTFRECYTLWNKPSRAMRLSASAVDLKRGERFEALVNSNTK